MEMTNETLETQVVFPANVVPDPAAADVPTWLPLLVTPSTKSFAERQLGFHHFSCFFFVEIKARSKKVTFGRFGYYQKTCLKYIHILCKADIVQTPSFHSYSSLPKGDCHSHVF